MSPELSLSIWSPVQWIQSDQVLLDKFFDQITLFLVSKTKSFEFKSKGLFNLVCTATPAPNVSCLVNNAFPHVSL